MDQGLAGTDALDVLSARQYQQAREHFEKADAEYVEREALIPIYNKWYPKGDKGYSLTATVEKIEFVNDTQLKAECWFSLTLEDRPVIPPSDEDLRDATLIREFVNSVGGKCDWGWGEGPRFRR